MLVARAPVFKITIELVVKGRDVWGVKEPFGELLIESIGPCRQALAHFCIDRRWSHRVFESIRQSWLPQHEASNEMGQSELLVVGKRLLCLCKFVIETVGWSSLRKLIQRTRGRQRKALNVFADAFHAFC